MSRRLLLLRYQGRRSGQTFEIPLRYAELRGGQVVVCAMRPARKLWWRSVRESAQVSIVVRGNRLDGAANLVQGVERDAALGAYAGGSGRITRAARDAAVVVVTLSR